MKCGHTTSATNTEGKPVCPICAGITPNAYIIEENIPNLTGRIASCTFCGKKRESDFNLPFFEYRSDKDSDNWVCYRCLG